MTKKETTKIIHAGHKPSEYYGSVNAPSVRASTLVYPSLEDFDNPNYKYDYGRNMTRTMDHFLTVMSELEHGVGGMAAPNGLSAITTSLLGFLKGGDHILVADCIYPPVRRFCNVILKNMGVEVTYYEPTIGEEISELIQDNTKVIYMESPGSGLFEMQDVPAIAALAKDKGIITMIDNTYASGVLFKPLTHGVDISIISCTKYVNGYADGMLGIAIAGNEEALKKLKYAGRVMGQGAGSEELSLGLRGLKTLHMRIDEAGKRGLEMAKWLQTRNEVQKVYHPALEDHPSHEIWKRDFSGSNGLVSILLKPSSKDALKAFIEGTDIFMLGDSWGAYESLFQPQYLGNCRSVAKWEEEGYLIRLHIGFEDLEDLKSDLDMAFEKFRGKL